MSAIREPKWGSYNPVEAMRNSKDFGQLEVSKGPGVLKLEPAMFLGRTRFLESGLIGTMVNLIVPLEGSKEPAQTSLITRDFAGQTSIARMMLQLEAGNVVGVEKLTLGKGMDRLPNGPDRPITVCYDYDLGKEGRDATLSGLRIVDDLPIEYPDPHNIEGIRTTGSFGVMIEKITGQNIGKAQFLEDRGVPEKVDLLGTIDFWLKGSRVTRYWTEVLLSDQRYPGDRLLLPE